MFACLILQRTKRKNHQINSVVCTHRKLQPGGGPQHTHGTQFPNWPNPVHSCPWDSWGQMWDDSVCFLFGLTSVSSCYSTRRHSMRRFVRVLSTTAALTLPSHRERCKEKPRRKYQSNQHRQLHNLWPWRPILPEHLRRLVRCWDVFWRDCQGFGK